MADDGKHSNRRIENQIAYAERWCDKQPVDQHGIAINESVGIIRALISRIMEADKVAPEPDESMRIYRGQSPAGFGLWREWAPGHWVFGMPVAGFTWRETEPPQKERLIELGDLR